MEQPIHFCKIDVEAAESDLLAGFDLPRCRPWVVVIAATRPQSKRHDELGQSIFLVATANGERGGQLPSFLYRSWTTERLGDVA